MSILERSSFRVVATIYILPILVILLMILFDVHISVIAITTLLYVLGIAYLHRPKKSNNANITSLPQTLPQKRNRY